MSAHTSKATNRCQLSAGKFAAAAFFALIFCSPSYAARENAAVDAKPPLAQAEPVSSKSSADSGGKALKPVLDPKKFFGHARSGYEAAKLCPEICAKLFCYCGCDMTDEHDSLLDCFTSDHGVDCRICQEEALIALKMKRDGKNMKQIQQSIDTIFEKEYPFDEPTATIKNYRANRLWQPSRAAAETRSARAGNATKAQAKNNIVRSKCCGGAAKHK